MSRSGCPTNELTALDDTLDTLLDKVAARTSRRSGSPRTGWPTRSPGLLDLARTGAAPEAATSRLRPVVAESVETAGGERPRLTLDLPGDQVIALPHALAVRAPVPVLDNALRLAEHVRVAAAPDGRGFVAVRVADDGPGVPVDQRESAFGPGRTDGPGSGAGPGLALARRIARSAGGDVLLDDDAPQTTFVIRFPWPEGGPPGSGFDRGAVRVDTTKIR